jgi:serine/threonine-protein kinase
MDVALGDSWDGAPGDDEDPLGTPLYMSPEQIEGLPDVDQRSDVWSLGAVLFEAFAGRPPFEEKDAYHLTLLAILKDDPPALARVAPWVPERVARVVDDMLVRDRELRIRDCQELIRRLNDAAPELRHGHKTIILTRSPDSDPHQRATDSSARLARVPEELPSDPTLVGMPRLDALPAEARAPVPSPRARKTPLTLPVQPLRPWPAVAPAATSSAAHVMSTPPMVSATEGPAPVRARGPASTALRSVAIAAGMFLIAAATGSITFATARHHAAARGVPSAIPVPSLSAPSASASVAAPPRRPR